MSTAKNATRAPWEETLDALRNLIDLQKDRARLETGILDGLVDAFYFAEEATKKLRVSARDPLAAKEVQGALVDILRMKEALVRTTRAAGEGIQIAFSDALELMRNEPGNPLNN